MRLGWLRVSVFTALIGVALASSYWVALLDREIGEGRGGDREFAENAWGVAASLAELRASQLAYIAADADRALDNQTLEGLMAYGCLPHQPEMWITRARICFQYL